MSIQVIPRDEQAQGAFDGGKILEHKPIGFPREGGKGAPVSSLFYWAHAWSDGGGLIDRHPHEGFEIMSYVLRGEIEHYDSRLQGWKRLAAGDVQLIRAGSGIVHAEKLLPGSAIFQIWFDPNLERSLQHEASYDDYPAAGFPVRQAGGVATKTLKGEGAPVTMETTGVTIEDQTFEPGTHALARPADSVSVACVLEGTLGLGGREAARGDAIVVRDEATLTVTTAAPARWFAVTAPARPGYPTYAELSRRAV